MYNKTTFLKKRFGLSSGQKLLFFGTSVDRCHKTKWASSSQHSNQLPRKTEAAAAAPFPLFLFCFFHLFAQRNKRQTLIWRRRYEEQRRIKRTTLFLSFRLLFVLFLSNFGENLHWMNQWDPSSTPPLHPPDDLWGLWCEVMDVDGNAVVPATAAASRCIAVC